MPRGPRPVTESNLSLGASAQVEAPELRSVTRPPGRTASVRIPASCSKSLSWPEQGVPRGTPCPPRTWAGRRSSVRRGARTRTSPPGGRRPGPLRSDSPFQAAYEFTWTRPSRPRPRPPSRTTLWRSAAGPMPLVASARLQLTDITDDSGAWRAPCPALGASLMVLLFLSGPGRDQQEPRSCMGYHRVPGALCVCWPA